jgi:hypothetical protein
MPFYNAVYANEGDDGNIIGRAAIGQRLFLQRMSLARSKDLEEIFQNHYGSKIIFNGFQRKNRPEYPKNVHFRGTANGFQRIFLSNECAEVEVLN